MACVLTLSAQSVYENEVINTIMARRSVRKYLDKPVEHEKLEAIPIIMSLHTSLAHCQHKGECIIRYDGLPYIFYIGLPFGCHIVMYDTCVCAYLIS